MTRLAPETPFSEQHAEPSPLALKWAALIERAQAARGPLPQSALATMLEGYEVELMLEIRLRTQVDGEETCEIEDSCGCVCCDKGLSREMHEGQMVHWGYVAPGTLSFVPCTLPNAEVLGCSGEETRQ